MSTLYIYPGRQVQFDVNIRLYEYWHEQVKIRKQRWNNKENIENKYVSS